MLDGVCGFGLVGNVVCYLICYFGRLVGGFVEFGVLGFEWFAF